MPLSDESAEKSGNRDEGPWPVGGPEPAGRLGGTSGSGSLESRVSSSAMGTATTYVAPSTCIVFDECEEPATPKEARRRCAPMATPRRTCWSPNRVPTSQRLFDSHPNMEEASHGRRMPKVRKRGLEV